MKSVSSFLKSEIWNLVSAQRFCFRLQNLWDLHSVFCLPHRSQSGLLVIWNLNSGSRDFLLKFVEMCSPCLGICRSRFQDENSAYVLGWPRIKKSAVKQEFCRVFLKSEIWNLLFGFWNLKSDICSFGFWNLKSEICFLVFEIWNLEREIRFCVSCVVCWMSCVWWCDGSSSVQGWRQGVCLPTYL